MPSVREVSPLNFALFEAELTHYRDTVKANFVLQGIKEGFRLGCDKPVILKSARRNKLSAYQHPSVIDAYLANEVRLGRVAGPFDTPPVQDLHISSFGVIPKKGQPDKWRLIVDLSSLQGHSVNDGIDPESWHLQYFKMDDIIKTVSKFGPGALMAKFDIESAYRNIAINPRTAIFWAQSGVMPITLILPYLLGFTQLQQFSTQLRNWLSGSWSITMALRTCCII